MRGLKEGNDGRKEDDAGADGHPATIGAASASLDIPPPTAAMAAEHTRSHAARNVLQIFMLKPGKRKKILRYRASDNRKNQQ